MLAKVIKSDVEKLHGKVIEVRQCHVQDLPVVSFKGEFDYVWMHKWLDFDLTLKEVESYRKGDNHAG